MNVLCNIAREYQYKEKGNEPAYLYTVFPDKYQGKAHEYFYYSGKQDHQVCIHGYKRRYLCLELISRKGKVARTCEDQK